MTGDILVRAGQIIDHGWEFHVVIAGVAHDIQISHDYWKKLTHGNIAPRDLIELALEYVREQHRLDSLLGSFSLEVLESMVVDFERHVRAAAQTEAATNPR